MNKDYIKELYNLYVSEGILDADVVGLDMFENMDITQAEGVWKAGIKGGLFDVPLSDFTNLFEIEDVKKKVDLATVAPSSDGKSESEEAPDFKILDFEEFTPEEDNWEITKKLKANTLRAVSSLADVPQFIEETLFATFASEEELAKFNELSPELREDIFQISNLSTTVTGNALAAVSPDISKEFKERASKIEETMTQFDQTITEDLMLWKKDSDVLRGLGRLGVEAVGSIPSFVQAAIPYVGLVSMGLGSAASKSKELQKEGEDLGLKTLGTATIYGVAEAGMEYVSKGIAKRFFKSFTGDASEEVITGLWNVVKSIFKEGNKEGLSEVGTEVIQRGADLVIQGDEEAFNNWFYEIMDIYLVGGASGGAMKTAGTGFSIVRQGAQRRKLERQIEGSKYENLVEAFNDLNMNSIDYDQEALSLDKNKKFLKYQLDQKVKRGEIGKSEAEGILNNFEEVSSLANQMKGLDLNLSQRESVLNLLREKKSLTEKIKGKDPVLVKKEIDRLKDVDSEIEGIVMSNTPTYSIDGTLYTKKEFTDIIESKSKEELSNSKIEVNNDDSVSEIVNNKIGTEPTVVEEKPVEKKKAKPIDEEYVDESGDKVFLYTNEDGKFIKEGPEGTQEFENAEQFNKERDRLKGLKEGTITEETPVVEETPVETPVVEETPVEKPKGELDTTGLLDDESHNKLTNVYNELAQAQAEDQDNSTPETKEAVKKLKNKFSRAGLRLGLDAGKRAQWAQGLEAEQNRLMEEASTVTDEKVDDELAKSSGTTQVATTVGSYKRVAEKIKADKPEGSTLDYGAGLGLGTDTMSEVTGKDVESFEINTERWKGKKKPTYTKAENIKKKFDNIVSLNVLNVVPKRVRDFIVKDIASKLNDGGKAYISTRKFSGDINNAKNFEQGPEDKSIIVKRKKDGKVIDVFQKGFDGNELVEYVQEQLGDGFKVERDNSFGASGVVVTKLSTKKEVAKKPVAKKETAKKPVAKKEVSKDKAKEEARIEKLKKEIDEARGDEESAFREFEDMQEEIQNEKDNLKIAKEKYAKETEKLKKEAEALKKELEIASLPDSEKGWSDMVKDKIKKNKDAQKKAKEELDEEKERVADSLIYYKENLPELRSEANKAKRKLAKLEAKQPKFQKGDLTKSPDEDIDAIADEMNQLSDTQADFDIPTNLTTKAKAGIKSLIKRFGNKTKVIKDISKYNGIPFGFTISDQLTSGEWTNPFTGTKHSFHGGLGFNLTKGNENNAWANVTEDKANATLSTAKEIYNNNKELFDKLWADGTLPNGLIPFAVVKMGQGSMKTNEGLFRVLADNISKNFTKEERANAYEGLVKSFESDMKAKQDLIDNPKTKKAKESNEKKLKSLKETLAYVKKYKTLDEVLANVTELPITKRGDIMRFTTQGSIDKDTSYGSLPGDAKPALKALIENRTQEEASELVKYFHLPTINNVLKEEATKDIPKDHIISVVGVDVLNPKVTKRSEGEVVHGNYPFGVKGELIGVLAQPIHAIDAFPEIRSKTIKTYTESISSIDDAINQAVAAGGPIAGIKAFRGAKLNVKMNLVSDLVGKLRQAFPSVVVVNTKTEFDAILQSDNVQTFVRKGDVVYGFTMEKGGRRMVLLNPALENSNTPIHEFGHVWLDFLRETNKELLEKGFKLLEGTEILKRKIAEHGNNDLAREEALAELIGNKGEAIVSASVKSKFKNWLNGVYEYIKNKLKGFDKMSAEEFQNMTLNDFVDGSLSAILGGEEITKKNIKSIGVKFQSFNMLNVIETGLENGLSEKQIKEQLEGLGFDKKQFTTVYPEAKRRWADIKRKEQGVYMKNKNPLVRTLKGIHKTFLSAKANAPKVLQIGREYRNGSIEAQVKQSRFYTNRLLNQLENLRGSAMQTAIDEVDAFMRGDIRSSEIKNVPVKMKETAIAMRNHIDKLTDELIYTGLAGTTDEKVEKYIANKGKYLTRSYRVFDVDDWGKELRSSPEGKKIISDAKNFFINDDRTQKEAKKIAKETNSDYEVVLNQLADQKVNKTIDKTETTLYVTGKVEGKMDKTILKERIQDLPKEIRVLMGEYTDPVQNYQRTIYNMSHLIENYNHLANMAKVGKGVWLFEENDDSAPEGFKKVKLTDSFGPLSGLYTSKEIRDALEVVPFLDGKFANSTFYRTYLKSVGWVKKGKTIYSPGTHAKNVFGNVFFMVQNGYASSEDYIKAVKLIGKDLANSSNEDQLAAMQEYIRLGIINQNATLRDVQAMFSDIEQFESTIEKINKGEKEGFFSNNKVGEFLKKNKNLPEKLYQAEDDFFKIVAFEGEYKRALDIIAEEKGNRNFTQAEMISAKEKAAEMVKQLLPNYDRIGQLGKAMKVLPIGNSFISFQLESYRTAGNTISIALEQIKSKNKVERAQGRRRLAGIISTQVMYHAIATSIGTTAVLGSNALMFGGSDEEDDKESRNILLKDMLPPWSRNSTVVLTGLNKGVLSYIDFAAINPHGQLVRAANAMFGQKNMKDAAIDVAYELVGSFFDEDITFAALKSIFTNEDVFGNELYTEETSFGEDIVKIFQVLYKAAEPGFVRSTFKVGGSDSPLNEFMGQTTGFKQYDIELNKKLERLARDVVGRTRKLKKFRDAKYDYIDGETTYEELLKSEEMNDEIKAKIYGDLIHYYKGAIGFGMSHEEVVLAFKEAGVPKYIIDQVYVDEKIIMSSSKSLPR